MLESVILCDQKIINDGLLHFLHLLYNMLKICKDNFVIALKHAIMLLSYNDIIIADNLTYIPKD